MKKKKLKKMFEESAEQYAAKFAKIMQMDFEWWIGDNVGEVAEIGDLFVDFSDIRYVVDNNISEPDFITYYYFNIEYHKCRTNIDAFCRLLADEKHRLGHNFSYDGFEKKLLHDRINEDDNKRLPY